MIPPTQISIIVCTPGLNSTHQSGNADLRGWKRHFSSAFKALRWPRVSIMNWMHLVHLCGSVGSLHSFLTGQRILSELSQGDPITASQSQFVLETRKVVTARPEPHTKDRLLHTTEREARECMEKWANMKSETHECSSSEQRVRRRKKLYRFNRYSMNVV